MTHTADQIIEAMEREIKQAICLKDFDGYDDVDAAARNAARAAYAVCLRMLREPATVQCDSTGLVHAMPDYHWRAMIDERIKELG